MSLASTARGLVELSRPGNAVASGALTFVGAFVTGGVLDAPFGVAAAVGATILGVAGGMAINDYFDREVDAINAPERPIPRGAVEPRVALGYAAACFLGAVALSLTLPWLAIAIAVLNLSALVTYTQLFKGLPGAGNALVAYLGGSTFLYGAAAVDTPGIAVVVLFALAALSTLARELIKDVEDVEGDRAEGLRTLPIVVGERPTLHLATVLLALSLFASPLPYVQRALGPSYLVAVVPALAIMAYSAYRSYDDPGVGHTLLKYGMYLATAAFAVGRLAPLA